MKKSIFLSILLLQISCGKKEEKIKVQMAPISESVYASGILKSANQYQAFATATGIIKNIFVSEGDTVLKGAAILSIENDVQHLNQDNAALAASFADMDANKGKLIDAEQAIDLADRKYKNDSAIFARQQILWQQNIGSKTELEQRELAYQNSKAARNSARVKYADLKRQLLLNAAQSQKNLQISKSLAGDYTLRSDINGVVYSLPKKMGELVSPQTPLAIIGDAANFVLEMQVDENDIIKVHSGLPVKVMMDSYKGKVFDAVVIKIDPIMNERSKTFLVEARFVNPPTLLYPNVSFEANIVLQSKPKAMIIPRNYLINDSFVLKESGDKVAVKTGLKDYKMIEIVSGLAENDIIKMPTK